jgi:hypothetical protein
METRKRSTEFIPLADMHTDGVRFNPEVLAALTNKKQSDQKKTNRNQGS